MTEESTSLPTLDEVDARIDTIDAKLLTLLNERAECALLAGQVKLNASVQVNGVTNHARPERVAQVLQGLLSRNTGPLKEVHVQRIFREILSAAEALEVPLTVAYLGPQGTYTEEASYKHFGRSMLSMPMQSIPDVFAAVENGAANFGVVPIENSTEGPINQTLDVLMESQLRICGEVVLRIHHQLMSHCTSLPDIKSVHAHPQSFAQCRGWLDANLPQAERITESSNAAAAQFAQSNPECAAIAGSSAAELYCLPILASKIEDLKTNTTRFVVIGDQAVAASGDDSTSILMSAPHKPGGLRSLLKPFEDQGISMTRIESRPMRNALWEYVFYIDVKGHQNDPKLALVLPQLKEMTAIMRVLGSYPSAL